MSKKLLTPLEFETENCERPFLGDNIPQDHVHVKIGDRTFALTPKAFKSYTDDYGLGDGIPFDMDACLEHIVEELKIALKDKPVSLSKRRPLVRIQSGNLIFKLKGNYVTSIRISLSYNTRKSSDNIEYKDAPEQFAEATV